MDYTDSTTRKNSVGARQAEHEHRYSLAKVFYHRDFQSMSKFTKMHKWPVYRRIIDHNPQLSSKQR